METLSKKSSRAVIWSAFDRIATQGINFLAMLYFARMLGPQAFGTIGMITIFISMGQVLSDGGLSVALLRKKNISNDDYNTAFIYNLTTSITIWVAIFALAPFIADFYQHPELKNIVRVLSLNIILSSLSLCHRNVLIHHLDFKKTSLIAILSSVFAALAAYITLQYTKSAWVLVVQQVISNFTTLVLCNLLISWKPTFKLSIKSIGELWSASKNIIAADMLDVFFSNIYNVAIGKNLSARELGHFAQANQLTQTPSSSLSFIINRVAFSTLSKVQDEPSRFSNIFEKFLTVSLLLIFPLIFLLVLNSNSLVSLILGKDWGSISDLIVILGLGYIVYPFNVLNISAIQIRIETHLFFKLEIAKKTLALIIFCLTFSKGITIMCIGIACGSFISIFINSFYSKRSTGLSQLVQLKIFMTSILANLLPAIACLSLPMLGNTYINILSKVFVYLLIYLVILVSFYRDIILNIWNLVYTKRSAT